MSSGHGHDGDAATGSTSWASVPASRAPTAIHAGRAPIAWSPPAAIAHPISADERAWSARSATVPVSARRKTPAAAARNARSGASDIARPRARTARPCASSDPMASSQRPSTSRKFRNRPDGSWTASSR